MLLTCKVRDELQRGGGVGLVSTMGGRTMAPAGAGGSRQWVGPFGGHAARSTAAGAGEFSRALGQNQGVQELLSMIGH